MDWGPKYPIGVPNTSRNVPPVMSVLSQAPLDVTPVVADATGLSTEVRMVLAQRM